MKLDKDKVVRKLKGNADAARHKEKLGGISKKMAAGEGALLYPLDTTSPQFRLQMSRRSLTSTPATRTPRCTRNLAEASASSRLAAAGERGRARIDCDRVVSKGTLARGETGQGPSAEAAAKATAGAAKGAEINRTAASSSALARAC